MLKWRNRKPEFKYASQLINLTISKLPEVIPLDAGFSGIHVEYSNFMRNPAYSLMLQLNYSRYWSLPIPGIISSELKGRVSDLTAGAPFLSLIASRILDYNPLLKPVKVIHWPTGKWGRFKYWLATSNLTLAALISRSIEEAQLKGLIKNGSGGGVINLIEGSFTYYAVNPVSELFIHITPNDPLAIRMLLNFISKL